MRANRWLCATLLVIAGLLMARAASAQVERVHLRYRRHAGCPDEGDFVAQVAARTSRATWVDASAAERAFEIVLAALDGETQGVLTIRAAGAPTAERRVRGASCQEVVSALALVVALAIDPHAKLTPPTTPTAPAHTGTTPADVGAAAPAFAPLGEAPSGTAPAATSQRPPPPRPPPPRPPPQLGTAAWWIAGVAVPAQPHAVPTWIWAVGTGARASSGLGDALAFVLPIYLELERNRRAWWSPSVRLGATILPIREIAAASAGARLSRYAAELSACPLRLELLPSLLGRPCLAIEGGALRAVGTGPRVTRTELAPWLALDLAARLELRPLSWLALELEGSGGAALVRPRFFFEPDLTVVQPAPLHGSFGGNAKMRFP